jgi:hypothetical protein
MGMIQRREEEANKAADKLMVDPSAKKLATAPVLDLKSRQIQAQGCWQAVASNPGLLGYAADVEALKVVIRELAEDGLAFIAEKTA